VVNLNLDHVFKYTLFFDVTTYNLYNIECFFGLILESVYIYPRIHLSKLLDTLSKTFFSIPHFNSGIHHFTLLK